MKKTPQINGVPSWLLYAVALTESGREVNGRMMPWPWTINVQGKGYFFATKLEAVEAVRKFQKRGITCIDVGCMQVNLKYHPEAFANLETAFDPKANIRYAARFLRDLKGRHGMWQKAVSHYHSALPRHGAAYLQRVMKHWKPLKVMFEKFRDEGKPAKTASLLIPRAAGEDAPQPRSAVPAEASVHAAAAFVPLHTATLRTVADFPAAAAPLASRDPKPAVSSGLLRLAMPPATEPEEEERRAYTSPDTPAQAAARKGRRIRATFVPTADLLLHKNPKAYVLPLPKLAGDKSILNGNVRIQGSLQQRVTPFISLN